MRKLFSVLLALLCVRAFVSAEENPAFNMLDARERGVFNIGSSQGSQKSAVDDSLGKNVLQLNYSIPAGTMVGVWTKSYPPEISAEHVNAVRFAAQMPEGGKGEISASIEIKGTKEVQTLPIKINRSWNFSEEAVDWKRIGSLKEAVLVVKGAVPAQAAEGTVYFTLDFVNSASLSKGSAKKVSPFNLLAAEQMGAFNIGPADGAVSKVSDPSLKKEVVMFGYTLPKGTTVGLWTKKYPKNFSADISNAVRPSVKTSNGKQSDDISVTVEIKGSKEVQAIPFTLGLGWNSMEEMIDWDKIGSFREAVFVVKPIAKGKTLTGTLWFDLDFIMKAPPTDSSSGTPASFSILDSKEKGAFNIGASEGAVSKARDSFLNKEVLKLDYNAPAGTVVGLWTKNYSPLLGAGTVNAVNIKAMIPGQAETPDVEMSLELKGSKNIQAIPVHTKDGWTQAATAVDWESIGDLREAVLVVKPVSGKSSKGSIYFDLDFITADVQKISKPSPLKSIAALLGFGLILGLLNLLIGKIFGRNPQDLSVSSDFTESYSFSLQDARDQGSFNIGPGRGKIKKFFDDILKRDFVRFDYKIPQGAKVGIWARKYPSDMDADTVDTVKFDVNVPSSTDLSKISAALEIKGYRRNQVLPIALKPGLNSFTSEIEWDKIGDLKEMVFILKPVENGNGSVSGTLFVDLEISRTSQKEKGVELKAHGPKPTDAAATPLKPSKLKRDILFGISAALIAISAAVIYAFDGNSRLHQIPYFLLVGLAGSLAAELLKLVQTKKHLTPIELFQDFTLSALIAASSFNQTLLQVPGTLWDILKISNLTASVVFVVYHAFNGFSFSWSGKHIRFVSGFLIASTPYLTGITLLLSSVPSVTALGNAVSFGLLNSWPAVQPILGRLAIVYLFNEVLANGISSATKGRVLKPQKVHRYLFLVSLGAVLSPEIADLGSGSAVAALPVLLKSLASILAALVSLGLLWAEAYLVTGMILDGTLSVAPSWDTIPAHAKSGLRKGMNFSGMFMLIVFLIVLALGSESLKNLAALSPLIFGALLGGLLFPSAKTVIETFDGSMSFFQRLKYTYKNGTLYARGVAAGALAAYAATHGVFQLPTSQRIGFGILSGLLISVGVNFLRDLIYSFRQKGRIQSWKIYVVDGLLGGFIGFALGFYLDSAQVLALGDKLKLYAGAGFELQNYSIYPILSKWGRIDLGPVSGGAKLLYNETLAGVIGWAVAAWLFAINRAFMAAFFQKETAPIKFLFSKAGFEDLTRHMIHVLRWGLWMAPIINTGLRMMAEATWYNQDGAFRTLVATYKNLTMNHADFQTWSLNLFVALLSFDMVRILIWIDHMGLRVATLVNLSFIGMDRLDEKIARFLGPRAAQRYIPESVKRFTTWAPLLIPFYIPRGEAWDYAWNKSVAAQNAAQGGGLSSWFQSQTPANLIEWAVGAAVFFTLISMIIRAITKRTQTESERVYELSNRNYKVVLKEKGEVLSQMTVKGYDISRRSYDTMDPSGRILFLTDAAQEPESIARSWPVLGNFPRKRFKPSKIGRAENALKAVNSTNGIKTTVNINLPDLDTTAEIWTITLENLTSEPRKIKLVPYLEWVLDRGDSDRGHTQYSRLFPEMEYAAGANAVFSWQKNTKSMGVLASDCAPEGFLTSRMDFIGRARSIWNSRVLETLNFLPAQETASYPTFDPIGSLLIEASLAPSSSKTVKIMIGYAKNKQAALDLVKTHLSPKVHTPSLKAVAQPKSPLIGHGEIPPGTPQPYFKFDDRGNKLLIHTPYTPRPFDHALSNAAGHYVTVTNRGLHTTSNGNSQQNRITPDWPDTVTREIPGEAIYLYETETAQWFSPTHHPLNQTDAQNECVFGVDGTALFKMKRQDISTELTVFVPPQETATHYLLKIKNASGFARRLRVAPYFQIVLAGQPEWAGPLKVSSDKDLNALYFENPRNTFRIGPVFASMSLNAEIMETKRGRFFGTDRGVRKPFFVINGQPDLSQETDTRPIAAFLGTVEVPAKGEVTLSIILGQTDNKAMAAELISKYKDVKAVQATLEATQKWWLGLMETVRIESNEAQFDQLQNWLKYQAIAERLWARRGFYQTSGAFGFRDQLQDSVNLIWADPALARKQILLHASQQFVEGDVVHWFHTLHDGRTAFSNRSHASDNLLWLPWAVGEYLRMTGDSTIAGEMTSYLRSENPFLPLPNNKHGWGTIYLRSEKEDTVYRHCMKSIDLVLEKRMGKNGIPLIGTGDWNDGLDEIGSEGRGESIWLGFFLDYILKNFMGIIEKIDGPAKKDYYMKRMQEMERALEKTWRADRYLRAFHDDGTEIGVKDSGVWEIDALTAAWAVMAGINFERGVTVFNTALKVLERDNVILLGWPALREDTTPYLGRSSHYPEGVRENGMYCHGDQWLVRAARILSEEFESRGDKAKAQEYRDISFRLWSKIAPSMHTVPGEIEIYGGQPNKQSADMLTTYDQGRMIWNGYTGAAGWMLRQSFESVAGAKLVNNDIVLPKDLEKPRGTLAIKKISRDTSKSPFSTTK